LSYLRTLVTPDRGRWQPMLMGLAVFAIGAFAAVAMQEQPTVSAVLAALALAAWVVGACAMVGYVRWYIAGEMERARREHGRR
jgi:hypothetical protein